jgi:hypothetical protein
MIRAAAPEKGDRDRQNPHCGKRHRAAEDDDRYQAFARAAEAKAAFGERQAAEIAHALGQGGERALKHDHIAGA